MFEFIETFSLFSFRSEDGGGGAVKLFGRTYSLCTINSWEVILSPPPPQSAVCVLSLFCNVPIPSNLISVGACFEGVQAKQYTPVKWLGVPYGPKNIDVFRGFIETFSLFWDCREALTILCMSLIEWVPYHHDLFRTTRWRRENCGGGGVKFENLWNEKKPKLTQWADNTQRFINKTNKAQASRWWGTWYHLIGKLITQIFNIYAI